MGTVRLVRDSKLRKRKKCDYCGEERPIYRPTPYGLERLVRKLPNGLWCCVMCAIERNVFRTPPRKIRVPHRPTKVEQPYKPESDRDAIEHDQDSD